MEGQSNQDNLMHLMSLNLGGFNVSSEVSNVPRDDSKHVLMASESGWNETDALNIPWWIHTPEAAHNYVKFIAESSSFLSRDSSEDVLESLHFPFSGTDAAYGVAVNDKLELACAPKSPDASIDMDALKVIIMKQLIMAYFVLFVILR